MEELPKKVQHFKFLMDQLRTEWFVFDGAFPNNITNINQIRTLAKQILLLDLNQEVYDNLMSNLSEV